MDELYRPSAEEVVQAAKIPLVIVLEDIRSMHNVGAVFRTADAFAVRAIHLVGFTPKPPHREIQKTALGATETVAWEYFDEIGTCLSHLQKENYSIVACEQTHNSTSLLDFTIDTQKKYALIMGNEVDGVSQEALSYCNSVIEIPQGGSKHSLNISVANGVLLWPFFQAFYKK